MRFMLHSYLEWRKHEWIDCCRQLWLLPMFLGNLFVLGLFVLCYVLPVSRFVMFVLLDSLCCVRSVFVRSELHVLFFVLSCSFCVVGFCKSFIGFVRFL